MDHQGHFHFNQHETHVNFQSEAHTAVGIKIICSFADVCLRESTCWSSGSQLLFLRRFSGAWPLSLRKAFGFPTWQRVFAAPPPRGGASKTTIANGKPKAFRKEGGEAAELFPN
jgi:hypothetical protein